MEDEGTVPRWMGDGEAMGVWRKAYRCDCCSIGRLVLGLREWGQRDLVCGDGDTGMYSIPLPSGRGKMSSVRCLRWACGITNLVGGTKEQIEYLSRHSFRRMSRW